MNGNIANSSPKRWLQRFVAVHSGEQALLGWAFAYFYCLLCSYYIIRPIRDTMGISAGIENMQLLYGITLLVMLALIPVFGWLTSRWPRQIFLPYIYGFFIVNLLLFYVALLFVPEARLLKQVFYLWVNIYNLFVVSVFWSYMADLFSESQAARLFGFIAAGGSAGAMTGPIITSFLIQHVSTSGLLLISAAFLAACMLCVAKVASAANQSNGGLKDKQPCNTAEPGLVSGSAWDAVRLLARSRYLQCIALFVLLYSVLYTMLYFQQNEIIARTIHDDVSRTIVLARLDMIVNAVALAVQLFLTGRILTALGLGKSLALVPVLVCFGLAALAGAAQFGWSVLLIILAVQGVLRAGSYALINPAREALYVPLSRAEKYRAKNMIDTSVFRSGDAVAIVLLQGFAMAGVGLVAPLIALALLWALVALYLGKLARMKNSP